MAQMLSISLESRNWLELPPEIMATILKKVGAVEILKSAEKVCSSWRKICKDPLMWRVIDTCGFGDSDRSFEVLCSRAVDRSSGRLLDINLHRFGSDELLEYISQSSFQLRRLGIVSCHKISDEGLIEAVSKFPLLEHLKIFDSYFETETLEMVGKCCPLLKSLKLNKECWDGPRIVSDEEALAIAVSMPKLQHLEIFANVLTNEGLQAILDGCPDLETLDLRECLNLDLNGQLGQECARRIKHLLKGSEKFTSSDHYDSCFAAYMETLADAVENLFDEDNYCPVLPKFVDFVQY